MFYFYRAETLEMGGNVFLTLTAYPFFFIFTVMMKIYIPLRNTMGFIYNHSHQTVMELPTGETSSPEPCKVSKYKNVKKYFIFLSRYIYIYTK